MTPRVGKVAVAVVAVLAVAVVASRAFPVHHAPAPKDPVAIGARLRAERLEPRFEALRALHAPLPPPAEDDWLALADEDGESFAEYAAGHQPPPPERTTLYLLPLGDLSTSQRRVLAQTAAFLESAFQRPVKTLDAVPASSIPERARRNHPRVGHPQLSTTFVMDELLLPRRPPDALAVLALTGEDLFPDPASSFVYGQSWAQERIGVWSLSRNGDAEREPTVVLRRTLRTAAHELSHVLGLSHCLAFRCLMNGASTLEEADQVPLEPCPQCLQKLTLALGLEPRRRFEALLAVEADAGLSPEAESTRRALETLRGGP